MGVVKIDFQCLYIVRRFVVEYNKIIKERNMDQETRDKISATMKARYRKGLQNNKSTNKSRHKNELSLDDFFIAWWMEQKSYKEISEEHDCSISYLKRLKRRYKLRSDERERERKNKQEVK